VRLTTLSNHLPVGSFGGFFFRPIVDTLSLVTSLYGRIVCMRRS